MLIEGNCDESTSEATFLSDADQRAIQGDSRKQSRDCYLLVITKFLILVNSMIGSEACNSAEKVLAVEISTVSDI